MTQLKIRDAVEADFESILRLNDIEVQQTSAMDLARLRYLHGLSSYHRVAEVNGRIAAFLLAMRSGAAYENENFNWFTARIGHPCHHLRVQHRPAEPGIAQIPR